MLLAGTLLAGGAAPLRAMAVDPDADFAAHLEHRGMVIDRMEGNESAVLKPDGSWFSNRYLLRSDGKTIAALRFKDPDHITVRQSADPTAPVVGRVEGTWDNGALRLTLQPADGPAYTLGRFHRIDYTSRPALLGSTSTSTILGVRGLYRAELRDAHGNTVGWLRLRITSPEGGTHIYDGSLPASLDGPLATAAVELVDADVDRLERDVIDVYQGD
jgi:hypothetical protein